MRDNLSLIFASMAAIIVLVLLPLLSIFIRQDNIATNVVNNIVSNFVDDVRYKGYMTGDEYNKLKSDLAKTGNIYQVDFEIHKNILIPTDTVDEYEEDTLVYYTADVLNGFRKEPGSEITITDVSNYEQNAYVFDEGDEVYVRAHTNGATMGSMLLAYFTNNETSNDTVDITYGGKIYRNTIASDAKKIMITSASVPKITISGPYNKNGDAIKVDEAEDDEDENEHLGAINIDITDANNKNISFDVKLQNFEYLYVAGNIKSLENLTSNDIKNSISSKIDVVGLGFAYSDIVIESWDISNATFKVKFMNISMLGGESLASGIFNINTGLGGNNLIEYSSSASSIGYYIDNPTVYPSAVITGPYASTMGGSVLSAVACNKSAYFKIECENSNINAMDALEIVNNKIETGGAPNLINKIEYSVGVFGNNKKEFWIKVTHNLAISNVENQIKLIDGFDGVNSIGSTVKYIIKPESNITKSVTISGPFATNDITSSVITTCKSNNAVYFVIEYSGVDMIGPSISAVQALINNNCTVRNTGVLNKPVVIQNEYVSDMASGKIWLRVTHKLGVAIGEVENNYISLSNNFNEATNSENALMAVSSIKYIVDYSE